MSEIKIHVLHTGTVIVDEALPFHHDYDAPLAWIGLFRSKEHIIQIPVSSYLIEHPKGLILVDTGWNTVNRDHQIRSGQLIRQTYQRDKQLMNSLRPWESSPKIWITSG